MKQVFYDLETTGTKYWRNSIHQLSGLVVIDGEVKEEFNFHVQPNPKAEVEIEALNVAGVTLEQIMAYPPMWGVKEQFTNLLAKYVDKYNKADKFFLCGYNNAPFDNQFLRAWFVQNGDNYFGSWFWSCAIDAMVLAAQALIEQRPMMKDFKLHTVAEQLGIVIEEERLHDAMYDIYITHEVYKRLTFQSPVTLLQ